jgi:hypothetical protein
MEDKQRSNWRQTGYYFDGDIGGHWLEEENGKEIEKRKAGIQT